MSTATTYADLLAELDRRLEQVGRHEPEGVHRARVACRRLRAVLATYRPEGWREAADELRWLGRELSAARDRFVVHEVLTRMLREEPRGLTSDTVGRRVERTYGGTQPVPDAFGTDRYAVLRAGLAALDVDRPDEPALRKRVRKDLDRVVRRHDLVAASPGDTAMHDLRKAAKRLRYSAEAWQPEGGKDARRMAKAAKRLTQHLGERQDTVLVRAHVLELAREASGDGEPTFTYGRLHAREQARAAVLDAALPDVWRRFTGKVTGPARRSTC